MTLEPVKDPRTGRPMRYFATDGMKFYFWDETGSEVGPYASLDEAREKLNEYVKYLNGEG